ncbi:MAG: PhoH family protein [Eubacteriales bacterium]|nr:PhoH family protein [Eubacteriales bacterium]
MIIEKTIELQDLQDTMALCGVRDENLEYMREKFGVGIRLFGSNLTIIGEQQQCDRVAEVIEMLMSKARSNNINRNFIDFVTDMIDAGDSDKFDELTRTVAMTIKGKPIKCKTYGQAAYVKAINDNPIVFGVGPAGTGKTYLAVALAVVAFKNKLVDKIILTRPAVEAGEKLGFLPGDLGAKVDPYLRPLYDALQEMFGLETYNKLMEKGVIEIAPLAYMRGRTLSGAFIILDEAQNTTGEQMKMFLTRMGEGSKIVVTGDTTQIDLPNNKASGLVEAVSILEGVKGIAVVNLTAKDIVRHPLVQAIVNAYEKHGKTKEN